MPHEITIDRDLCQGCGQCLLYAPNTFGQDESLIAIVIDQDGDPTAQVEQAAKNCPTGAIEVSAA
jgi:ferredoxin